MQQRKYRLALPAAVLAALLLVTACGATAATGTGGQNGKGITLTCGSADFTEVQLHCAMAKMMIEARTPNKVKLATHLGSSTVVFDSLKKGDIDIGPAYTGTLYLGAFQQKLSPQDTPDSVWESVRKELQKVGIYEMKAYGYNNVYAVSLKESKAKELGVSKVSDLKTHAPNLVLGTDQSFPNYPGQGYKEFTALYGFQFKSAKAMDYALMYRAVDKGDVDAIMAYSTDGRIQQLHLTTLEDDKHFNPPYYGMLLLRQKLVNEHPEVLKALEPLAGAIDTETMRTLNAAVDVDQKMLEDVARDFLTKKGLLSKA